VGAPIHHVDHSGWGGERRKAVQGVVHQAVEDRLERRQCLVAAELQDDVVEDHLPMKQRGGDR
jgi:hypothetical protein